MPQYRIKPAAHPPPRRPLSRRKEDSKAKIFMGVSPPLTGPRESVHRVPHLDLWESGYIFDTFRGKRLPVYKLMLLHQGPILYQAVRQIQRFIVNAENLRIISGHSQPISEIKC